MADPRITPSKTAAGSRRANRYLILLPFLFVFLAPLFLTGYWVRFLANVFMFGVLTQGVNIIAGYCGYLALGNILFFGLGAYITAVLMTHLALPFTPPLLHQGLGQCFFLPGWGFSSSGSRGSTFSWRPWPFRS